MYKIVYQKETVKFLRKLSPNQLQKIKGKMEMLANNPFGDSQNLTALKGLNDGYRLRIGNLRVIYEVNNKVKSITVWKIGFRGSVYKM